MRRTTHTQLAEAVDCAITQIVDGGFIETLRRNADTDDVYDFVRVCSYLDDVAEELSRSGRFFSTPEVLAIVLAALGACFLPELCLIAFG